MLFTYPTIRQSCVRWASAPVRHSLATVPELPDSPTCCAVEAVQLVEHIGRGAASAAAKGQDKSQDQPDDAQAAPAQRDRATAHAAAGGPESATDRVPIRGRNSCHGP